MVDSRFDGDAWKRVHDLYAETCQEWEVRHDLKVTALGPERGVRLTIVKDRPGATSSHEPKMHVDTGKRNVSTMRELAQAILDACDFVEAVNPEWAKSQSAWNAAQEGVWVENAAGELIWKPDED
jgi:hypothetical protein